MRVAKFGGTSLATATRFRQAAEILLAKRDRKICVCSAPGKRFPQDRKITDLLIDLARSEDEDRSVILRQEIEAHFQEITEELGLRPADLLNGQLISERLQEEEKSLTSDRYDGLITLGELFSASVMAAYLRKIGCQAQFVGASKAGILVHKLGDHYQVHQDSLHLIPERLLPLLQTADLLVIPGFYGRDAEGRRRPLSRGGSDVTAAWLASALQADCEIWTDVSGVFVTDPRVHPLAQALPQLSYEQMLIMAEQGASVLHPEAIWPLQEKQLKLYVKNSFQPEDPGTYVGPIPPPSGHGPGYPDQPEG
ncbi:MAG: aspartate kinase [Eubacteriales bacterium]|nr:aspartate kinase [Eubacteriales bacterium]